ncbi:MAG: prepilin-type N-terminal cleavage/methylation domain-containing protein [Candidatus Omnitrophota bacterium]
MKKNTAFSLVELLVASAIFVVIMLTVYSSFHTGIFGYRKIKEAVNIYQTAGLILERINLDLANSFSYSAQESKFSGAKSEISFLSLVDTFSQDKIRQDYALVSYKLDGTKLMRLCRKNQEALNNKSEAAPDEMADNIKEVTFSYGYISVPEQPLEWKDLWDDPKSLPLAVKVSLILSNNKAEQDFERTIFFNP